MSEQNKQKLYKLLGYTFNNSTLLQQALTRKSSNLENKRTSEIGHNERLEFLGDSILRMAIDDLLLEKYPHDNEHILSKKRDVLVARDGFLLQFAESIQLFQFINLGKGEQYNFLHGGKVKILTDVMEAIIAAIFLDCDRNYIFIKEWIQLRSPLRVSIKPTLDEKLIQAVVEEQVDAVEALLKQGANPNSIGKCIIYQPGIELYDFKSPSGIKNTIFAHFTYQGTVLQMAIYSFKIMYLSSQDSKHNKGSQILHSVPQSVKSESFMHQL